MERTISIGINCDRKSDIKSLNGPEIPETQIPILEQVTGSETDTDTASRETSNKNAMKQYEAAEEKRINEEKRKFNGSRQTKADKKLRSILFFSSRERRKKFSLRRTRGSRL